MLWVKWLHIVFMVTWFAGLFYLPRLFVYHAQAPADDRIGIDRFKTMERKLYRGIMAPAAVLTVVFGLWLWLGYGITGAWLHAKVTFVAALPLRYRFCAITFGHVVVCTDQWTAAAVRAHEHVHVHQYERLGALFFPLYIGSSVAQLLRGRDPYFENRFEREACALADR